MPTRTASASWKGGLRGGTGSFKGQTGLGGSYTFGSRFENASGSNPEELLAAAEAACFSMALAAGLERGGTPATSVDTSSSSSSGRKRCRTSSRPPGRCTSKCSVTSSGARPETSRTGTAARSTWQTTTGPAVKILTANGGFVVSGDGKVLAAAGLGNANKFGFAVISLPDLTPLRTGTYHQPGSQFASVRAISGDWIILAVLVVGALCSIPWIAKGLHSPSRNLTAVERQSDGGILLGVPELCQSKLDDRTNLAQPCQHARSTLSAWFMNAAEADDWAR